MSDLSGATVLVTGASGFIGGAAARQLQHAGAIVHCVSRHAPAVNEGAARWWQADLTDITQMRRILEAVRPDFVLHLAGVASGARDLGMVLPSVNANLIAAVNLLVAATERRVGRLLFAGSVEEPQPDAELPLACSPYAAAKFGAAVLARMCHAQYGTPAIWLRVSMVYGPGQTDVSKLVPYVTLALLRGEAPALASGRRLVDWVYIDDVVDALLTAAVGQGLEGQTLDVGSGRLVAVRGVVDELVRLIDPNIVPRFGVIPERAYEPECAADAATTAAKLGWQARTSLEDGLRTTVDWYRRHRSAAGPK